MNATDRLLFIRKRLDTLRVRKKKAAANLIRNAYRMQKWEIENYKLKISQLEDDIEELKETRNDIKKSLTNPVVVAAQPESPVIESLDLPMGAKPLELVLRLPDE